MYVVVFVIVSFAAAFCVVYTLLFDRPRNGGADAAGRAGLYAFLLVAFWLLESFALVHTPYYSYPDLYGDFPMMLPAWDFSWAQPLVAEFFDTAFFALPCPRIPHSGIPAIVPIMEASLTFGVLQIAAQLDVPLVLRPAVCGLVFTGFDVFLDPVVAQTYDCSGALLSPGLGFWVWYLPEEIQVNAWFGVPLFNYGAWFSAPIAMVAAAQFVRWSFKYLNYRRSKQGRKQTLARGGALLFMALAFFILFLLAPAKDTHDILQVMIILTAIYLTAIALVWFKDRYVHDVSPHGWLLAYMFGYLLFPLVAFLLNGYSKSIPYLWFVALVTVPLVSLYLISPSYELWIKRRGAR